MTWLQSTCSTCPIKIPPSEQKQFTSVISFLCVPNQKDFTWVKLSCFFLYCPLNFFPQSLIKAILQQAARAERNHALIRAAEAHKRTHTSSVNRRLWCFWWRKSAPVGLVHLKRHRSKDFPAAFPLMFSSKTSCKLLWASLTVSLCVYDLTWSQSVSLLLHTSATEMASFL